MAHEGQVISLGLYSVWGKRNKRGDCVRSDNVAAEENGMKAV